MAASTYQTAENVKFNGTTTNSVVVKNSSGIKSLVVCDQHNAIDVALLDALILAYGGVTPLAGPTAGKQTVNFGGVAAGGSATGLSSVAAATAGYSTINVGGAKVGGSATGLSSAAGTAGYQVANFSTTKAGADATGLAALMTAGYQQVNVGGAKVGADATSLVGATTYTATITVDSVAKPISILGSSAATFTTLLAEINTDLAGSAVATLVGGNIRVTSVTSGTSSTVAITAGTLFAAPLAGFVSVTAAVPGTAGTALTATITVDGVAKPISILPQAAQTFTTLLAEINTDLAASATAAISGGDIRVTSATLGTTSKVSITAGTLFAALTDFVGTIPASDGDGTTRTYSAIVVVDGVEKSVRFTGVQGNTYTNLLAEINTDLGGTATAALNGGNIRITSATTGLTSSVVVYDSGSLFSSLTSFAGVTAVAGTAPTVYTATITVDGVVRNIAVQGSAAQTFTTLVSEINTDLAASAVAAITGGNIVITSATTGALSTVSCADGTLFKALQGAGFVGFNPVQDGAVDLLAVMQRERMPNGTKYSEYFNMKYVGAKPPVPPNCPKTVDFIYHNGTVWKYLSDDTNV